MTTPGGDTAFPSVAAIATVQFRLGLKGYNVDEVDVFLGALAVETERLVSELEAAKAELASLRAQLTT
jgi:DivIVA domain-containing protein